MELKLERVLSRLYFTYVLIVPYGIETDYSNKHADGS